MDVYCYIAAVILAIAATFGLVPWSWAGVALVAGITLTGFSFFCLWLSARL